jgi:outer membrane lipoprotein SlyB
MHLHVKTIAYAVLATALASCQSNVSPDTYAIGSVGQVNRAVRGTVISARPIAISGSQSGAGVVAGAAGGGIAGFQFGNSGGAAAATLAGVVVGGIVGAVAEEALTRQTGVEYVIQTENGSLINIVQGSTPSFAKDQKVIVIYGSRARAPITSMKVIRVNGGSMTP